MVRQQFLTGMPFFKLVSLLLKHGFDKSYVLDVIRLLKVGLISTLFSLIENFRFHKKINITQITQAPIFIIGHWRSGTTYLQKILAQDEQLTTPTFYQCALPQSFISSSKYIKPVLMKTIPATRIFDGMAFGVDEPFDDDFALLKLTGTSRMLHFAFPRYTSFNDHANQYPVDESLWCSAFMFFSKKLTFVTGKRLLFKSPMNTIRIKELLKLFPDAKFIYLHRHPEDVYVSSLNHSEKLFEHNKLNGSKTNIKEFIFSRYLSLYDAYEKHKKVIPSPQLIEISFQSLETSPIDQIKSIYEKFGLDGMDQAILNIEGYIESTINYKKNSFDLPENDAITVKYRWQKAYKKFGYT